MVVGVWRIYTEKFWYVFRLGKKRMIDYLQLRGPSVENGGKDVRYFHISNLFQYPKFTDKKPGIDMLILLLCDTSEIVQCIHI